MTRIEHDTVVALLVELGLTPLEAQRAAGNKSIVWTEAAIMGCVADVENSTMRMPARALWSTFLSKGLLPQLPKKPTSKHEPPSDTNGYQRCEVQGCHANGDLAVCRGLHGYAINPGHELACWNCGRPFRDCLGACPRVVEQPAKVKRAKKGAA